MRILPGLNTIARQAEALKGRVGDVIDSILPESLPAYKEDRGPYQVKTTKQGFVDEARHRKIPLKVYSPEGGDPNEEHPVVVFSHGLAGNSLTYDYIGKHLASHGYLVLQPTHVGSDTYSVLRHGPLATFQQSELVDRGKDVTFCLDRLEEGKVKTDVKPDMEHVGLAGHSFGALTAQAMAGLPLQAHDGHHFAIGDERIDAFVAMSPYGDSAPSRLLGLDVNGYDHVDQPIMYLSGSRDTLFTMGRGAKTHLTPYYRTPGPDKYHVLVGGARHEEFAQVLGQLDRNLATMVNSSTTAFFDAYLRDDPAASHYLHDELGEVALAHRSTAMVGGCTDEA